MRIFIVLSLLVLNTSFAGNVVVLTSLELSKKKLIKIERLVLEHYSKDSQDVIIQHNVKPIELFNYLLDGNTEKLIWISHSAKSKSISKGFKQADTILDVYGNNVQNFFSTSSPNLKFLAIVGCEAKGILEGFARRGNYIDRPNLNLFSFEKKTKIFKGLKMALKASTHNRGNIFTTHYDRLERSNEFVDIAINSTSPVENEHGWVEMGDRVLGYISARSKSIQVKLPHHVWYGLASVNLRHIRDKSIPEKLSKTPLKIAVNGSTGLWKPFNNSDGQMIGVNSHLYVGRLQ